MTRVIVSDDRAQVTVRSPGPQGVTGPQGDVPGTRIIATTAPLTGGGTLAADRTLGVAVGTTAGTVAAGNDSRITGAVQASTATTKGDLLARGASALERLPVGVAGTNPLLIPDTSAAGGLKWGTWTEADVVQRSLYDANTILAATTDNTPAALTVGASTVVGRAASGNIAALTGAQVRTITGLATTDSPTFAGGTIGAASTGPTLSAELGDGTSATQALTGLTVGVRYQVAAIGGTMTAATLDGTALSVALNASSFVATATAHTVAKTAGTATGVSVKAITAAAAAAPTVGGASVRARNQSYFVGGGTGGQWLTTGSYNNATGHVALYSLTTGSSNNAVGHAALYSLTTGSYNNATGQAALYSLTTGSSNNAVGHAALAALTTGSANNAVGHAALYVLTTGAYNNAVGHAALYSLTTGSYNNAVGYLAGRSHTTGSYNLALGNGAAYTGSSAGLSGTVAIGDDSAGTGAVVTADNQFVLGTALHNVRVPGRITTLGGRVVNLASTAVNRSIGAADHVVAFTASATATLPTATTAGQTHVIKAAGAGVTVTLATTSSQTIDGAAPGTVAPWGKITVVADGANWITI